MKEIVLKLKLTIARDSKGRWGANFQPEGPRHTVRQYGTNHSRRKAVMLKRLAFMLAMAIKDSLYE